MAWYNESRRHSLASRGVKTAVKGKPQAFSVVKAPKDIESSFEETNYSFDEKEKYISKKYNNGEFDYYLVLNIIDFEEATGEKIEGKRYVAEIKAVAPSLISKEEKKSVGESMGVDLKGLSEKDQAIEIEEYGISAPLFQETSDDKKALLRKAHEQEQIIPNLFGFYMDKQQNALGATGWDIIRGDYGIPR